LTYFAIVLKDSKLKQVLLKDLKVDLSHLELFNTKKRASLPASPNDIATLDENQ